MRKRRKRGRRTSELIGLLRMRFHACEVCSPYAFDYPADLMDRMRLTRSERKRLERNIVCPYCESPIRDPHYDAVVAYTQEELSHFRRRRQWCNRDLPRIQKFNRFLERYPALGGLHAFGRTLMEGIRSAPVITLEEHEWYRARRHKPAWVFTKDDFLPRDPASNFGSGRF